MNGMNLKNFSTGTFCFKSVASSNCGYVVHYKFCTSCHGHFLHIINFENLVCLWVFLLPGSIHNTFHFISDLVYDRKHVWLLNAFTLLSVFAVVFFRTGIMCISGHYSRCRKESWLRKMVALKIIHIVTCCFINKCNLCIFC